MPTILIIDDTPFWRDLQADALRPRGYDVISVGDGLAGLEKLSQHRVDLIILDVEMPKLDGFAFLERVRGRRDWQNIPVIMLTGAMRKEDILRAKKLGAADYLLKSRFSPDEMLERVGRRLNPAAATPTPAASATAPAAKPVSSPHAAPASLPKPAAPVAATSTPGALLTREQTLKRVEKALEGRIMSGVAADVITLCTSPRTELSQLTTLISRDPMLSVKVLQAANTAGRASAHGIVSSLSEAVRNLGCKMIGDIAASVAVIGAMPPSEPDGFNPIRCWQHSLAVATLCNQLTPPPAGGAAYLIGLCHDLGDILLRTHFGTEYRKVLEAHKTVGGRLDDLMRNMLGLSYGQLVQAILKKIGLPETIRGPITAFHDAGTIRISPDPMARLLQIADLYATGLLLPSSEHSLLRPLTRAECAETTTKENPPQPDGKKFWSDITAMTVTLGRLSAADEEKLMQPIFPRESTRLWLTRDAKLSSFDPIAAALTALADVTISENLPHPDELESHNGLVIASSTTAAQGTATADVIRACTRADGETIPVLWLAGRVEKGAPDPAAHIKTIPWLVQISALAEFVQMVAKIPVPAASEA